MLTLTAITITLYLYTKELEEIILKGITNQEP